MAYSGNKTHRLALVCTRPRALAWCDVVHFFMPFSLAHTGVLMARLGVDARFGFMPQPRLRGVLAQTDVYVHASDMEAEAMSCMEAFATGLVPIIANSPLSATPQFALDDRSLFAAGDPQELARHLDWWIEHPRERERMGHAYAREAEGYRIGACVGRFERMLRRAVANASAARHAAAGFLPRERRAARARGPHAPLGELHHVGRVRLPAPWQGATAGYWAFRVVLDIAAWLATGVVLGVHAPGRKNLKAVRGGFVRLAGAVPVPYPRRTPAASLCEACRFALLFRMPCGSASVRPI